MIVHSPAEMPDPSLIKSIAEPIATATIYSPSCYLSTMIQFIKERRGQLINSQPIGVRTNSSSGFLCLKLLSTYKIGLSRFLQDMPLWSTW